jgi:hypothetical protein
MMLTPAASDQAARTRYTGILGINGRPTALSSEAMTRGKSVYPMMDTDWKKALPELASRRGPPE